MIIEENRDMMLSCVNVKVAAENAAKAGMISNCVYNQYG
jgi:hypothetical protein